MSSWTLANIIAPDLPGAGKPLAFDELWKAYEQYARNVAESLGESQRAANELSERYAEVVDRIKMASEELDTDLLDIHEQFQAELAAVAKSPLVDRCKRAYQALVETYIEELATVTSMAGRGPYETNRSTHRAAEAYARAVDDLNSETARQVAAAYGRYLSGLSRAATEADLSRIVAAGNEELVHTLSRAYRSSRTERLSRPRPERSTDEPTNAPEAAAAAETSAEVETEDPWAAAAASTWEEAETPTWEDIDEPGTEPDAAPQERGAALVWDAPRSDAAVAADDVDNPDDSDDSPWGLAPTATRDEGEGDEGEETGARLDDDPGVDDHDASKSHDD